LDPKETHTGEGFFLALGKVERFGFVGGFWPFALACLVVAGRHLILEGDGSFWQRPLLPSMNGWSVSWYLAKSLVLQLVIPLSIVLTLEQRPETETIRINFSMSSEGSAWKLDMLELLDLVGRGGGGEGGPILIPIDDGMMIDGKVIGQ